MTYMPYELAHIIINPADAAMFEAAVARCAPLFEGAKGCRSMALERQIEDPSHYLLRVEWDTVDDHMIDFRQSPAFAEWRAAAGPFFTAPPIVVHSELLATYFTTPR